MLPYLLFDGQSKCVIYTFSTINPSTMDSRQLLSLGVDNLCSSARIGAMLAHLFFNILGLRLDFRAEAIDLLCQPLTNPGNFVRVHFLKVLIAEVHACAFSLALVQKLTDAACNGEQNSMIPASHLTGKETTCCKVDESLDIPSQRRVRPCLLEAHCGCFHIQTLIA